MVDFCRPGHIVNGLVLSKKYVCMYVAMYMITSHYNNWIPFTWLTAITRTV